MPDRERGRLDRFRVERFFTGASPPFPHPGFTEILSLIMSLSLLKAMIFGGSLAGGALAYLLGSIPAVAIGLTVLITIGKILSVWTTLLPSNVSRAVWMISTFGWLFLGVTSYLINPPASTAEFYICAALLSFGAYLKRGLYG